MNYARTSRMNARMRAIFEYAAAFIFGGVMYGSLETVARGYTHPSMLLTGGVCFAGLYAIDKHSKRALWVRILMGAALITAAEFTAGCICNLWLGWDVWNYSHIPFNLLGQICPRFTVIWAALTIPAYWLAAVLRGALGGNQPSPLSAADSSDEADAPPPSELLP